MINPTTHVVIDYALPSIFGGGSGPCWITSGPDGNLWFTYYNSQYIGKINPTTLATSAYPVPTYEGYAITSGPDGNIWFSELGALVGRVDPASGTITEFAVPAVYGLVTGPDGNLWFTDGNIGAVTLVPTTPQLVVTQQPPSVTAGSGFGLTVQAEDSSGNLVSSFNGTVTVALAWNPGGATLGGTLTAQASGGVATFSGLTLATAASGYKLVAASGGIAETLTNAIDVTPAGASQIVITQQPPATVKVNTAFAFQASIEDAYGNAVTSATNTVSVAFANNPTGATLGGTLSVTASQGVASFTNLTINKTGSGYTLRVSSSGLSSAVTSAINVTKTGKTSVIVAPSGSNVPESLLAPLVLDSPDFFDTLRIKKRTPRT
jgi:hypothetical protein